MLEYQPDPPVIPDRFQAWWDGWKRCAKHLRPEGARLQVGGGRVMESARTELRRIEW